MSQPLGTRSLDSFRDPLRRAPADVTGSGAADAQGEAGPQENQPPAGGGLHVGEVIESSTAQLVAESVQLNGAPGFGQFVRIDSVPQPILGVVHNTRTQSLEANRRPSAYGKSEEELRLEQPQIFELLRTHFDVFVLGYFDGDRPVLVYPPQPARIHSFVHECDAAQIRSITDSDQFMRSLLHAPGLPTDELLLATLCRALDSRDTLMQQPYLLRIGKELSRLLRDDYDRLSSIVRRLKGLMNPQVTR
ncbi:MAG: hypothetical protein HN712_05680 [Gemmatimonadetes bacterium]|nr:hypothetical protein [Gemmatimonadota bacterium]MBT6148136.1 hypothetical protein [Gemmatimonadota bacterium]MBT7859780.1 hypothetical protein [Gemmatimonadota bacterium]